MKTFRSVVRLLCFGLILALAATCFGQCAGGMCRPADPAHPAVVRIVNVLGAVRCYGSGTLIDKDDRVGLVLTCAHLFRQGVGDVTVRFPEGQSYAARVLAVDRAWDLAALEIAAPAAPPVSIAADFPRSGDAVESCGYGPDGRYACNRGRALGYAGTANTEGHETLELSGAAREGDSGGPVFNQRGELAAVLWGTDGRTVQGTYCGRIRKFLSGVLVRLHLRPKPPAAPAAPPREAPPIAAPPASNQPAPNDTHNNQTEDPQQRLDNHQRSISQRMEQIEKALALLTALRERVEKAEAVVGSDNLRAIAKEVATGIIVDQGPGLVDKVLPTVLNALGWTGPPSLATVLAVRLFAGLLKRRIAKKQRAAKQLSAASPPRNDGSAGQVPQAAASPAPAG